MDLFQQLTQSIYFERFFFNSIEADQGFKQLFAELIYPR